MPNTRVNDLTPAEHAAAAAESIRAITLLAEAAMKPSSTEIWETLLNIALLAERLPRLIEQFDRLLRWSGEIGAAAVEISDLGRDAGGVDVRSPTSAVPAAGDLANILRQVADSMPIGGLATPT